MNTCIICKKQFDVYEYEHECTNCNDDGLEERWYDWCIYEPDYVQCSVCKGEKTMMCKSNSVCSDWCLEEYLNPTNSD